MADQARTVRQRFAEFEQRRYGRPWTSQEIMLSFVGDVGDLPKLVQGKAGVRLSEDLDRKVAHELAHCLWAVLTLADIYAVDLETAFSSSMTSCITGWTTSTKDETSPTRPTARADRTTEAAIQRPSRRSVNGLCCPPDRRRGHASPGDQPLDPLVADQQSATWSDPSPAQPRWVARVCRTRQRLHP